MSSQSPSAKLADLKPKLEKAKAEKDLGNGAFKAGDLTKALRHYWNALLQIKGADKNANNPTSPITQPVDSAEAKIKEIDESKNEEELGPEQKELEAAMQDVSTTLVQLYSNFAMVYFRKGEFVKCRDNAEKALAINPTWEKALLKKAQSNIQLGQLKVGKEILLEMQQKKDDASIQHELKNLALAEKAREETNKKRLGGFLNKQIAKDKAASAKITEID